MKKIITLILALSLCLSFAVSCKGKGGKDNNSSSSTSENQKEVIPPETVLHSSLYEYNLADYVKLKVKYEDLLLSQSFIDEQVQNDIKDFLSAYGTVAEYEEERLIENDDIVELYYTGYPHDKSVTISEDALSGMTNADRESGTSITIGKGQFIGAYESEEHPEKNNPGFGEQLIGHKKGDKFTITVTFPDDYSDDEWKEFNGLVADFDIEIVSVSYIVEKELTLELLEKNTQYTSIEDFMTDAERYFKKIHTFEGLKDAIEIVGKPDEKLTDDLVIVEFLFDDLGLELTQGEYEEKLNEHYQANAAYYFYYFGITSAESLEQTMGKDQFIMYFEEDMVKEKLLEYVTMID